MKAVLISIQPKYCELIASGRKTVEVRKTRPKIETPFKCYIYKSFSFGITDNKSVMCKGCGKVIGEFICDEFDLFDCSVGGVKFKRFMALYQTCLSVKEISEYLKYKNGYGWRISDLKIYDKPKELGEFNCIKECEPLANWCRRSWDDRHKRCTASCHGVPIECCRCPHLIAGEDYLDEKSGVMLFDYTCNSQYHKPIARPPQSWCYIDDVIV